MRVRQRHDQKERIRSRYAGLRIYILGLLAAWTLWLLNKTLRWEWVGFDEELKHWPDGEPRIGLFWHNRQLMMPWAFLKCRTDQRRKLQMLISSHADGRIIAAAIRRLDVDSVAGSSTRGGSSALRRLMEALAVGHHIAITPDGPRGPVYKLKPGAVRLALQSGKAILPGAYAAERAWRFSSWDGMILPKPFSRAVYVIGTPIFLDASDADTSLEQNIERVENSLNAVTRQADEFFSKGTSPAVKDQTSDRSANCA